MSFTSVANRVGGIQSMLSNNDTNVNPEAGGSASPQDPWKSVTAFFEFRVGHGQQLRIVLGGHVARALGKRVELARAVPVIRSSCRGSTCASRGSPGCAPRRRAAAGPPTRAARAGCRRAARRTSTPGAGPRPRPRSRSVARGNPSSGPRTSDFVARPTRCQAVAININKKAINPDVPQNIQLSLNNSSRFESQ